MLVYHAGGGISPQERHITLFADGRVDSTTSWPVAVRHARVPRARVEKLTADIAATGAFEGLDGAWTFEPPVPDGTGSSLTIRDASGKMHCYRAASGIAPKPVEEALSLASTFADEVQPLMQAEDGGAP